MFWEAKLHDGIMKKEVFGDIFSELDKSEIEELILREQPSMHSLPMDLNSNYLKIVNLNRHTFDILEEKPNLNLYYDPAYNVFRFSPESLDFLKSHIIENVAFYPSFGISSNKFLINNADMHFKVLVSLDSKQVNLFDLIPKFSLDYICNAYSDNLMGVGVLKRVDVIESVNLMGEAKVEFGGVLFNFKAKFSFIPNTRMLKFSLFLTSSVPHIMAKVSFSTPSDDFAYNIRLLTCPTEIKASIHTFNN